MPRSTILESLAPLLLLTCFCTVVGAADRYFIGLPNGGTANWNVPSNWSGDTTPTPEDAAWILDDDPLDRAVVVDTSVTASTLQVGNSGGGLTTLSQTADLTLSREVLGIGLVSLPTPHYVPNSHSMHIQNGGSSTIGQLTLAEYNSYQTPSSGRYILNGGTLSVGYLTVANSGCGTFEQNGGVTTAQNLYVSSMNTAAGSYALNAGTLNVTAWEYIGYTAIGTFTQTGGTHVVDGVISIGEGESSLGLGGGTYLLSGADSTLETGMELIGRHADGTFVQSAGKHEVRSRSYVGYLRAGVYHLTAGSLAVAGELDVGYIGRGTFDQSGGAVTVGTESTPGTLTIGASSWGRYCLYSEAASLRIWGTEYVGHDSRGWFYHSAGTHTVSETLSIGGYSSEYHLSGGTLSVGEWQIIGQYGTGAFTQTGGINCAGGGIYIGDGGSYALSGGTLEIPKLHLWPKASFSYDGGTLLLDDLWLFGRFSIAPGGGRALSLGTLNIENGYGQLDLADNSMIIEYAGDSPGQAIEELREDLHDGALFSSITDHSKRLGYADNRLLHLSSFAGQVFPADDYTQLLVMYTFAGDANLDGLVNVADLSALATNWQQPAVWTGGDFDDDGIVNVGDLGILASNWQKGADNPPAPTLSEAMASLGLPSVAVPEPIAVGCGVGLGVLAGVRQRTHRRAVGGRGNKRTDP